MTGHAITAMTVANRWRGEGEKEHIIDEFTINLDQQPQSTDEQLQIAQMFTYAMGGQDLRKKDE